MTTKCVSNTIRTLSKIPHRKYGQEGKRTTGDKQGELEYKLKFNCKPCEMEIWEKTAEFRELKKIIFIKGADGSRPVPSAI
jgi:putative protease